MPWHSFRACHLSDRAQGIRRRKRRACPMCCECRAIPGMALGAASHSIDPARFTNQTGNLLWCIVVDRVQVMSELGHPQRELRTMGWHLLFGRRDPAPQPLTLRVPCLSPVRGAFSLGHPDPTPERIGHLRLPTEADHGGRLFPPDFPPNSSPQGGKWRDELVSG
jgi:hypothetical protein